MPSDTLKRRRDACGHSTKWTRRHTVTLYGQHVATYMIRRRSKCIPCGERTRITVTI